jgi:hypothetical protein
MEKNQEYLTRMLPKTYMGYLDLLRRCYDPAFEGYQEGGAQAMRVSKEWLDLETGFVAFVEDVGPCPSDYTRTARDRLH